MVKPVSNIIFSGSFEIDSLAKMVKWFSKEEENSKGSEFGIELMLKRIEEEQKEK